MSVYFPVSSPPWEWFFESFPDRAQKEQSVHQAGLCEFIVPDNCTMARDRGIFIGSGRVVDFRNSRSNRRRTGEPPVSGMNFISPGCLNDAWGLLPISIGGISSPGSPLPRRAVAENGDGNPALLLIKEK